MSEFKWTADNLISKKTATAVLFKPDKSFHLFGFKAENEYARLAEEGKHKDWYFFQRFKMQLYEQKVIPISQISILEDTFPFI